VEQGKFGGGAVEAIGDPPGVVPLGAEATARAFARALLARDPQAAAALFSSEARLITPDGTEVVGREQIGAVLTQLTSSSLPLEIRTGRTIESTDLALCTQLWRRGDMGGDYAASSTARLVLARLAGDWKIVMASPWE
jgi:ketosteroid isomerase-like protein